MTKISEISFLNFFSIMISLLKIKISAPERMNFNDIFYVANQIILLQIRLKKEVQENYNNSRSYPLLSTNFTLCFASSIDWILAILASCSAFSSFSYKDIGLRIKRLNLKAPPDIGDPEKPTSPPWYPVKRVEQTAYQKQRMFVINKGEITEIANIQD